MPLYEVAVIEMPEDKKGSEKLITGPTAVIAKTEQAAGYKLLMENLNLSDCDPERLQVLVRPFA